MDDESRPICFSSEKVRIAFYAALQETETEIVKKYLRTFPHGSHTYIYPTISEVQITFEAIAVSVMIKNVEVDRNKPGPMRRAWRWLRTAIRVLLVGSAIGRSIDS